VVGCEKHESEPRASASAPASVGSVASAAPEVSAAPSKPPRPAEPDCKALAKKKLVAIGSFAGKASEIAVREGNVFVLLYAEMQARIEVVMMPRDGGKPTVFGRLTMQVQPGGLVVAEDAAFYSVNTGLMREPFDGTKPTEIARGLSKGIAVRGDEIFAVRCPEAGKEELVRLPTKGGAPTVVASFAGAKFGPCNVSSIALDADSAFVSDWAARRVLRVGLRDGKTQELSSNKAFPKRLALGPTSVVFQTSNGLVSVPKTGGAETKLASIGTSPFHLLAWDRGDFYIMNEDAYSMRAVVERMPRSGGKRQEIEWFQVKTVPEGSGVTDMAADEQCLYLSRWDQGRGFSEVLARPTAR
jgi:hypothetical protein